MNTTYTPDGFDRLGTLHWPDGTANVFGYTLTDANDYNGLRSGLAVTWTDDALNRPIGKTGGDQVVVYTYDLHGWLHSAA